VRGSYLNTEGKQRKAEKSMRKQRDINNKEEKRKREGKKTRGRWFMIFYEMREGRFCLTFTPRYIVMHIDIYRGKRRLR